MKKLFASLGDEDSIEKIVGGIFGIIAIIAAVVEMALGGFDAAAVAGGVKDIAGTLVTIVMLVVAINALKPRKKPAEDFEGRFGEEMERVIAKYDPLIRKDETVKGRYNIADDMAVLYENKKCGYDRLFDFDYEKGELTFFVHKKLFMGRSKDDFSDMQVSIIKDIAPKAASTYDILDKTYKQNRDGFTLTFSRELCTGEDASKVVDVIDKIILLYIAEYKKA